MINYLKSSNIIEHKISIGEINSILFRSEYKQILIKAAYIVLV